MLICGQSYHNFLNHASCCIRNFGNLFDKKKKKRIKCSLIYFIYGFNFSISGYVFWCLFQGLAPMIWFYPLNDLEISGYEAFAGLWFLQIIAGEFTFHEGVKKL